MKKVALVFVVAVILPSLVLAWLAVRSLRDQQFLLERQQSLLDQRVTDALAQNISDYLSQRQQEFSAQVESLAANRDAQSVAAQFDNQIRQRWPLAEVGFCVTLSGKILSPPPNARPAAQMFRLDNSDFLGNLEAVEVYWNANNFNNANGNNGNAVITTSSLTRNSAAPSSSRIQWQFSCEPPSCGVAANSGWQLLDKINRSKLWRWPLPPAHRRRKKRHLPIPPGTAGNIPAPPAKARHSRLIFLSAAVAVVAVVAAAVVSAAAVRADKINSIRRRRKPIPPTRFHNSGSKRPLPRRRNRMFRLPQPCRSRDKPRWTIRSR